jgi:anti-sigma B factor antagonist
VLDIKVESVEGCTLWRPEGELDAFNVSQFRQALGHLEPGQRLVIDLSGVPFLDSAGLGAMIGGVRRARELGGDLAVCCARPSILRLLRTTGFDRIAVVADTVGEAISAVRPEPSAS